MKWGSLCLVVLLLTLLPVPAAAQPARGPEPASGSLPSFSKLFLTNPIGPGSTVTLRFTITNPDSTPVSDMAFVDNLPAAVTISAVPAITSTCAGTVTAPPGGGTITFSDGTLASSSSCTIRVNVTSSTEGTHQNVTGDLTSSAGNSGSATADLTVTNGRPGFTKVFAPASVNLGGRSTLTFTVDNTANGSAVLTLDFDDNLPSGMVIANPNNLSTNCRTAPTVPTTLVAEPGTTLVSYLYIGSTLTPAVPVGQTCTLVVDVVATASGSLGNVSGDLLTNLGSVGKAAAALVSTADPLGLRKAFKDDPVPPGGTVTLEFRIDNRNRDFTATDIEFTDDLDATLSGLVAMGLPAVDVCGPGSTLSGTDVLTLTGGNLAPGGSCVFSATLSVPAGATAGAHTNTTSTITGDVGGVDLVGSPASDDLFVSPAPTLTKEFIDDPVGGGGTVTLRFTIQDTSTTGSTDITFQDAFDPVLPTAVSVPADGSVCGGGSDFTFVPLSGGAPATLILQDASLAAGASCTFDVVLNVAAGAPGGGYPNVTSEITATVDAETVTGAPASDTLLVAEAPRLSKEFTDDPVQPGATATLEFTIEYGGEDTLGDALDIAFMDNLDAVITGLVATGLPASDVCGTGSTLSGTSTISLTGGSLMPGDTCVFSVTVQVPAGATPGAFTNTTSSLTATVLGSPVVGNPASADLEIAGLTLTKSFTDDPVIAGGSVTLEFVITNLSPTLAATSIFFDDDLDETLENLAVDPGSVPVMPCGGSSAITLLSGDTFLRFTGGDLAADTSCTFSVILDVPAAADSNVYPNVTAGFGGNFGGGFAPFQNATDSLVVDSDLLDIEKEFIDDPVPPGDTVTLRFTLSNLDSAQAASAIAFTDDLDAALSGLVATGLPASDVCGLGSVLSGTGVLTLTGGSLAASGSCSFDVVLNVPASTPGGTVATNTTSNVTGTIGGLGVIGVPATDDLRVDAVVFSKSFDGLTTPGGMPVLTFTIENQSEDSSVSDLSFSDNLDAVLTGLVATGLPMANVCGAGSLLSGAGFLTFTGGNLPPSGSCSFAVTLQVPIDAPAGTFPNVTSDLLVAGLPVAAPATDDLTVEPPPTFAKAFAPDTIAPGGVSTLTFTIDNSASALDATALDFTDALPAAIVVASPSNASTTCTGGTLTAVPGSGTIAYTGGAVSAGASCTVQADVTSAVPGAHTNVSGDLTSSNGNSGTATDTLTVTAFVPPAFSKLFAPDEIDAGQASTLTFTIDNSASLLDATALDFTDNLPAGVEVASPSNAATTCTGGTLTATAGSGTISYTGGSVSAGAVCTVTVDVTSIVGAVYVNVSGDLTSSLGNSGSATDTLTVNGFADLSLTLGVVYDPAVAHTVQVYDLEVTNDGPSVAENTIVSLELPSGTYYLGSEPGSGGQGPLNGSTVDCSDSGVLVVCDLGDLGVGETVEFSVGAFIDARFDGVLDSEALVASDLADDDESNNEMDASTPVSRPRAMLATERADGTEILVMVAKEADETIGLIFAEAAGGGARDYSVTGIGFRTVALAEVPDFADTPASEVAALASGFGGGTLVDVVDVDSTALIASHPIAGNWIPIDIEALPDFTGGGMGPDPSGRPGMDLDRLGGGSAAPDLALLMWSLDDEETHIVVIDAADGSVQRDVIVNPGKSPGVFPIDLSRIASFTGTATEELVAVTREASFGESLAHVIDVDGGFVFTTKSLLDNAFPIAIEGLEDFVDPFESVTGPEVAVLQRDISTGVATAEIFDAGSPFSSLPSVPFDPAILAEVMLRIDSFGDGATSELAVGGRDGMDLAVEIRDAESMAVVGSIGIAGGSPLCLDLAFHPSFAGSADPDLSVLFELFGTPTEVSVFDASGGGALFTFILP